MMLMKHVSLQWCFFLQFPFNDMYRRVHTDMCTADKIVRVNTA